MTDRPESRNGTILVVCTGNVCRSPYIERRLSAALEKTSITVSSAGTGALAGSKMDPRVARRLSELGLSAEGFVARQLTAEMARSADLILGATREHRSSVARMEPSVLRRAYAFADFSDLAAHLVDSGKAETRQSDTQAGTFVQRISDAAARGRGGFPIRTKEEAEIVDPFRASERILNRMIEQVDSLLLAVVAMLAGRPLPGH